MFFYPITFFMAIYITFITMKRSKETSTNFKLWSYFLLGLTLTLVVVVWIFDTHNILRLHDFVCLLFICQFTTSNFVKIQKSEKIVSPKAWYIMMTLLWLPLIMSLCIEVRELYIFLKA